MLQFYTTDLCDNAHIVMHKPQALSEAKRIRIYKLASSA